MKTFKEFLIESERSEQHERDIRDAFKSQTLPDKLPKWMLDLDIIPGATVVSAKKTGNLEKADIIITFDKGRRLKISAKLSNAEFYGNWYGKQVASKDFGNKILRILEDAALEFVQSYRNHAEKRPFVGCSISFGKRQGETGKSFEDVIGGINKLRLIIAGSEGGEHSANCLYMVDKVPKTIKGLLNNIRPISNRNLKELLKDFKVIFRMVYVPSSNTKNQSFCRLVANKKLKEPVYIKTQEELLQYTTWKRPIPKLTVKTSHDTIIKNLAKNNIFFNR